MSNQTFDQTIGKNSCVSSGLEAGNDNHCIINNKLQKVFDTPNKKAFIAFLTAGDPTVDNTVNCILEMERAGVPAYEYTPMQVKQAVAGYGGADKRQVMLMTQRLLNMKEIPRPDDAADALAIAICHGRSATSLLNTERVFDPKRYDTR